MEDHVLETSFTKFPLTIIPLYQALRVPESIWLCLGTALVSAPMDSSVAFVACVAVVKDIHLFPVVFASLTIHSREADCVNKNRDFTLTSFARPRGTSSSMMSRRFAEPSVLLHSLSGLTTILANIPTRARKPGRSESLPV